MSPELEEFKASVIAHAKLVVTRAPRIDSEAGTNTSLVQPFLKMLGYDVGNPDEVSPEHHADFSEKYQNKVDYAIIHKGLPVIAIESKKWLADARRSRAIAQLFQRVPYGKAWHFDRWCEVRIFRRL